MHTDGAGRTGRVDTREAQECGVDIGWACTPSAARESTRASSFKPTWIILRDDTSLIGPKRSESRRGGAAHGVHRGIIFTCKVLLGVSEAKDHDERGLES